MMLQNRSFIAIGLAVLSALSLLGGCSQSYSIQGRVVRGATAEVLLVDKDDPRLTEPDSSGGGAVILAVLEPNTPTETQSLGRHVSNGQGWFAIPVDAFASGLLEYEAQIVVRREGNQGVMDTFKLPRGGKRVLVTLPLGRDTLVVPGSFLDQTLRDAKPYLEQNR